jgi:flavin reductase (DIM6/NTAB) family NADH-FMN oxidoreductase RutF
VDLRKELAYCGTKSGKDYDKWKETGLTKIKANKVPAYLVDECNLHYECKIIAKTPLLGDSMHGDLISKFYPNENYHVLYFGEIIGTYVK